MYGSHPYASAAIAGLSGTVPAPFAFVTKKLNLYYQNLLESGTVTVTSENTSFPKYRLYDRAQGLFFKGNTAPSQFDIDLDLGAAYSYPGVDTIILPANHNFAGKAVRLYYSDNGTTYYQVLAWIAESALILKSFSYAEHRYWRFRIDSPSSAPETGELFLTRLRSFERNPNWGYGYGKLKNVKRLESEAGYSQKTKWGSVRKRRRYHLTNMASSQRVDIETFEDATESIKNFYIEDLEGNLFFADLPELLPDFVAEPIGRWGLDLLVQEVLD